MPVSGLPARVEEVQISCSIRHPWPADLEVILRCPARRTLSLHQRRGFGYDGLELQEVVASSSFRGLAANGKWELLVRDLEQGDIGFIDSVALTITAR
jgi:subtilisin-like proprotein convertase family protein